MFLSVGVTQGSAGQKGAVGLPGITGNKVRIHITLHPVAIIYSVDHTNWCVLNKTTAMQPSDFIPLSLFQGVTGRKGEKGEPGARGTRVNYRHCVHGRG